MTASRGPLLLLAVLSLALGACRETSAPSDADRLRLAVRPVVEPVVFGSTGDFVLDLVPSDGHGNSFVTETWSISAELSLPSAVPLPIISQVLEPADTIPVASAILVDNSGSMRFSDPDRHRAAAAALFWEAILPARFGNLVALLDFGRGDVGPTPGFERTRVLAGFTSDGSELETARDQVQAAPGGATPLYTAAAETIAWMDSTTPGTYQRSLVVITDGDPTDPEMASSLFSAAASHDIRIFGVGIRDAAQHDPPSSAAMRVAELATRTGGIYAAAESAAELQAILQTLAKSTSPPRLLAHLRLDAPPPSGTTISGTVTVSGERGSATAPWSFTAP